MIRRKVTETRENRGHYGRKKKDEEMGVRTGEEQSTWELATWGRRKVGDNAFRELGER